MAKLKPGDKIGPFPYQIVKQLGKGQGNMSDVYLATESERPNARLVVLKISRADSNHGDFFTDTIYNEAERLRQLSHPGIVHLLPLKTNSASMRNVPYVANASLPGRPWFLVLEHLSGGALDEVLNKEKRLPQVLALRIAQRLAATLDYIHRCGQVHLDIKPENILFRRELAPDTLPDPVLIDFGIARNVGQEGLEARTLHYSPPERVLLHKSSLPLEALARPAPSMDVYSLGVVLYQMLTGRRPYDGHSDKRISSAILNNNPTKPSVYVSDLDRDVENIVLQAMAKDPAARPTAGEMAQRLEAIAVRKAYGEPQRDTEVVSPGGQKGRKNNKQSKGARSRSGVLAAGGVTLTGLLLVIVLFVAGWLPPLAGPIGDGRAANGPVQIAWQTVTATAANSPAAVVPTSTPVPPRPTATGTPVPTSTAVRKTDTPTPPATATDKPTAKPTIKPTIKPTTAASVVAVTFTPIPTATPTRAERTSTPVARNKAGANTVNPAQPPTTTLTILSTLARPDRGQSTAVPERATNTPTLRPATATPAAVMPATRAERAATAAPTPAEPTLIQSDTPPLDLSQATVRLLEPVDGYSGHGAVTFRWATAYRLQENQAFEPVFWRPGGDPMRDGRGYGGATRGTSITINWDMLNIAPDGYQWGVLLVEMNPYKRILPMGGANGFQFSSPAGSEDHDGSNNEPQTR